MCLIVLHDDPGERITLGRERITVYLNGEEVKHCLTADDIAGEVVSVETDDQVGCLRKTVGKNGRPVTDLW
jgi:hypothetical protein